MVIKMVKMVKKSAEKVPMIFICKECDYSTCQKSHYNKHLLTRKHKMITNDNKSAESAEKVPIFKKHTCICGKIYTHASGLSRHKKDCRVMPDDTDDLEYVTNMSPNEAFLLEQNKKLENLIIEQSKQINELIPKIGNQNNTINNNQRFNINVFLNETCKDALSITDFVNSLQLKLEDLMYSKENGTIEGISNIIVKGLNELEVEKRPVHCTDIKRETLYIKDAEGWEKENKDQDKMKKMITTTQRKHGKLLIDWQKQHPNWQNSDALTDEFHELVQRLTFKEGGENKIIKNIAKETQIGKVS